MSFHVSPNGAALRPSRTRGQRDMQYRSISPGFRVRAAGGGVPF